MHLLKDLDENLWQHAAEAATDNDSLLENLGEAPLTEVVSRKKAYGFTIVKTEAQLDPDHLLHQARLSERSRQYRVFKDACTVARDKARAAGIEPLAVLPIKAWEAICRAGGLYRFENLSPEGTVRVINPFPSYLAPLLLALLQLAVIVPVTAGAAVGPRLAAAALALLIVPMVKKFENSWSDRFGLMPLFAYFSLPAAATILTIGLPGVGRDLFLTAIFSLIAAMLSGLCLCVLYQLTAGTAASMVTRAALALLPAGRLCRLFWPQGRDLDEVDILATTADRAVLHVSFPDPPASVQEIVEKAGAAYPRLCVAAVPGAITLGLVEIIAPNPLAKDPIIYVRDGDIVTVLAQFGDFPVEEKTIRTISSVDFLPAGS